MQAQQGQASSMGGLLMMVILLVLMYFMMVRPQKKRMEEDKKVRESLKVGDMVVTIGGLRGKVIKVTDDTFTIVTGRDGKTKGSELEFVKEALQYIVTPTSGYKKNQEDKPAKEEKKGWFGRKKDKEEAGSDQAAGAETNAQAGESAQADQAGQAAAEDEAPSATVETEAAAAEAAGAEAQAGQAGGTDQA
jgi:preprotein translocase subunit YajC